MKIALIGATGFVGGYILAEALNRGHMISGISRHPEKMPSNNNLKVINADIYNAESVSINVSGHDAVISAFNPGWGNPDIYNLFLKGSKSIIKGVKKSGVKRFLMIGGGGSLEIKPGLQFVDTPEFPIEFKDGALGARDMLDFIKKENDLDWTVFCPSIFLEPGMRTNKFRIGTDQLIMNEKGDSRISTQDLAVAIIDEIENPKFIKKDLPQDIDIRSCERRE